MPKDESKTYSGWLTVLGDSDMAWFRFYRTKEEAQNSDEPRNAVVHITWVDGEGIDWTSLTKGK